MPSLRRSLLAVLLLAFFLLDGGAPARGAECVDPTWTVDAVRLPREKQRAAGDYVELGDVVAVKSAQMKELRKCATDATPMQLYLNGMAMPGVAEFPASNPSANEAWFTLRVTPGSRSAWNTLLGRAALDELRPVVVSLGLANGFPINSSQRLLLRPIPPFWFSVWAAVFLVSLIGFFWLAARSNLIRGGTPAGLQAFSIGRSQAAWWFFIVFAAYLFIGLVTGDYTTSLNGTALGLLTIAAGTHLASAAVDASKDNDQQNAERAQERGRVAAAAVDPAIAPHLRAAAASKLEKLDGKSQGWLIDVLSDADGIDFHRFQMLAWNFVLGVIFVTQVWQGLAMPDFNAALIGLLGLSAATFVGLKIPEATK